MRSILLTAPGRNSIYEGIIVCQRYAQEVDSRRCVDTHRHRYEIKKRLVLGLHIVHVDVVYTCSIHIRCRSRSNFSQLAAGCFSYQVIRKQFFTNKMKIRDIYLF